MADGQPSEIFGAMSVPPSTTVTYDYRAAAYATAAAQLTPGTSPTFDATLYETANPANTTQDAFALVSAWSATAPTAPPVSVTYNRPFDASWSTSAYYGFSHRVSRALPGSGTPYTYASGMFSMVPLATFTSTPIEPALGPVVDARINGMDFVTDQNGATLTPTLSWSAPTLGTAARYEVRIDRLALDTSGATRIATSYAINTGATSITIPPGLLVNGQTYVFGVSTVRGGTVGSNQWLGPLQLPYHYASIFSGLVRP